VLVPKEVREAAYVLRRDYPQKYSMAADDLAHRNGPMDAFYQQVYDLLAEQDYNAEMLEHAQNR
jgi:hypothetical protein